MTRGAGPTSVTTIRSGRRGPATTHGANRGERRNREGRSTDEGNAPSLRTTCLAALRRLDASAERCGPHGSPRRDRRSNRDRTKPPTGGSPRPFPNHRFRPQARSALWPPPPGRRRSSIPVVVRRRRRGSPPSIAGSCGAGTRTVPPPAGRSRWGESGESCDLSPVDPSAIDAPAGRRNDDRR